MAIEYKPATQDAEAALQRILASAPFQRSARLQAFLRFIAEARLAGREELKEYELGIRIFDRRENYDPQADPIVRVQARQLRYKLREYYESEGASEEVRIELPKGTYLPLFHRAAEPDPILQSAPAIVATPVVLPGNNQHRSKMLWILIPLAVLVAAAILFAWNRRDESLRTAQHLPNAEAQDLYAKGRYYWSKRSPEALNTAVDYFVQAIVRDPSYAKAYVGLADSYNLLREFAAMPSDEAFRRATAAARRAVALDDRSAEAHASLAFCLFWGAWEEKAGLEEFRRAIALNPSYATAHHWYATALLTSGHVNEALTEIRRARELDSGSASIAADEAFILLNAGKTDQALNLLKQLEASDPAFMSPHTYLAKLYFAQRDYHSFIAESERAAQLAQDRAGLLITTAARKGFAEGGYSGMLERMLKVQEQLYADGKKPAFYAARTAALLGKHREAIMYLEASLSRREMVLLDAVNDPAFADLHTDPAWARVVASISAN